MRIPRIFCANKLQVGSEAVLSANASNHILHVLRLKLGSQIILFNGQGGEYACELFAVDKKNAVVKIKEFFPKNRSSKLNINLAQGLVRGEKWDYIIQKAVELGVSKITPLFTEYCNVKLGDDRLQSRLQRWRSIVISACEQSGRNLLPIIEPVCDIKTWFGTVNSDVKLIFCPEANCAISDIKEDVANVVVLIGPEGGLSDYEIETAKKHGFTPVRLGPRILRTETASLTALAVLQAKWGDFGEAK